jgi:hypothetical protein
MSDTFWVALGSIGGTLGFAAIAWQASLMRADGKTNRLIAADYVRARLDLQAPAVTVQLDGPQWPPYAAPSLGGMPVSPWPADKTWHFPAEQDGANRIYLQQQIIVVNETQRRIQVRFDGDLFTPDADKRIRPTGILIVFPGQRVTNVYLQKQFTVKEMAENYAAREAGDDLPHAATGTVTVDDDRDNGSTDVWQLRLTGCPVQPVPDRDGLWQITPYHITAGEGLRSLDYELLPSRKRTYWISRAKQVALPDPEGL